MRQQINLYQPIFRTPKRVFSALALLQVVGLITFGCVSVYAYGAWQVRELAARVATLEHARTDALNRLETLRQQFPERAASPLLQAELASLRRELQQAEVLAETLTNGALGNTSGLSAYLAGLARQHVAGTWLTHINIANGGSTIGVRGQALTPDLVPAYVRRLANEPVFAGKSFSRFKLEQATAKEKKPGAAIEFSIETEGVAGADDKNG